MRIDFFRRGGHTPRPFCFLPTSRCYADTVKLRILLSYRRFAMPLGYTASPPYRPLMRLRVAQGNDIARCGQKNESQKHTPLLLILSEEYYTIIQTV